MLASICPKTSSTTILLSSWEFHDASVLAIHQVPPQERRANRRVAKIPAITFRDFPCGEPAKYAHAWCPSHAQPRPGIEPQVPGALGMSPMPKTLDILSGNDLIGLSVMVVLVTEDQSCFTVAIGDPT